MKTLAVPMAEFCAAVGVKRSLGFELVRRGEVEAVKLGSRKTVITVASIEAMLARNMVKRGPDCIDTQVETLPLSADASLDAPRVNVTSTSEPRSRR